VRAISPNQQNKQHSVVLAVDAFIDQGLPAVLMRRVELVTRENRTRGTTPAQQEYAVERQRAAECLFFLYYMVRVRGGGPGLASPP
jgi:hypothetical protein